MKLAYLLFVCFCVGVVLIGRGCSMAATYREQKNALVRYERRTTESEKLLTAMLTGPIKISWRDMGLPDKVFMEPVFIFHRSGAVLLPGGGMLEVQVEGECRRGQEVRETSLDVDSRPALAMTGLVHDESIANLEKLGISPSFIKTSWTPYDHDAVYKAWIGVIVAGKGGIWMKWTWDSGLASGQVTHALAPPGQQRTR